MGKKQVTVSLRKPPPPADLEAFIHRAHGANEGALAPSHASDVRELGAPIVTSGSGREFREMVLYLPEDLTRKVRLHCVDADRDVSNMIAEVLREHLEVRERATLEPEAEETGLFAAIPRLEALRERALGVVRTFVRLRRSTT
jgi:hypothetical protein